MKLKPRDLKDLCTTAQLAAKRAGDIILSYAGQSVEVNSKDGGENIASCVVTEVDLKCQDSILKTLNSTLKRYDLGLLAEEGLRDDSRFKKDYFWCIDPLDGTLAFSRNQNGYSVSIALVTKEGEAVLGVVYNPRKNDLYSAILGLGAYKNNSLLKIEETSKTLTLFYDHSYTKHKDFKFHKKILTSSLSKIGLKSLTNKPLGGAVMNAIGTIEHSPALYFKIPKYVDGGGSSWDFAASSIIQKESGGYNSDYYNKDINLNCNKTTFMNKNGVIFASSKEVSSLINYIR